MNNRKTLIAALLLLLGTACQKDHTPRQIELLLEPMGSTAKLAIDGSDGTTATWSSGDAIRFNGTVATVIRETNGHTYVDNSAADEVNRALFPTTLASSGPAADLVTVSLPASYDYATDGAQQKLALPMAARATGNDPLPFMHLTGALCFTLQNSRDVDLTLDSIVVVSSGYLLNGSRQVDLAHLDTTGAVPTANAARRKVTMTFERQSLVVPAGESRTVVLPVAPVGDTNHFTVAVTCHHQGVRYTFRKRQTSGGPLRRNQIGYVAVALDNDLRRISIFEGEGNAANPYLIRNTADFLNMVNAISSKWTIPVGTKTYDTMYYKFTADIDLSGISINPIFEYQNATIDGDGHKLKNLTINSTEGYCALFRSTNSSTMCNLTLQDLTLRHSGTVSNLYLGGICATSASQTFDNCHVNGLTLDVSGSINNTYFGGMSAFVYGSQTLTDCSVTFSPTLNVTPSTLYGGLLLGQCSKGSGSGNTNVLTLTRCTATAPTLSFTSYSLMYFGGLISNSASEACTLTDCTYNGYASLQSTNNAVVAGGLLGRYTKGTNGSMTATGCSVQGSISTFSGGGTPYLGAFIGLVNGTHDISSCTNNITLQKDGTTVNDNYGN